MEIEEIRALASNQAASTQTRLLAFIALKVAAIFDMLVLDATKKVK